MDDKRFDIDRIKQDLKLAEDEVIDRDKMEIGCRTTLINNIARLHDALEECIDYIHRTDMIIDIYGDMVKDGQIKGL